MHQFEQDRWSGAGNCTCGAPRHHRVHPHEFTPSIRDKGLCMCALSRTAECHATRTLSRDLEAVITDDIKQRQARSAPTTFPAYGEPDNACGHPGGAGLRADHMCRCRYRAYHPLGDPAHQCQCGASWDDGLEPQGWDGDLPKIVQQ